MRGNYKGLIRKSWGRFWKAVKDADVILEVLDARDPDAFRLKEIEKKLIKMGKKLILVINKSDLVPRSILDLWKKHLEREYPVVYISARFRLGTGILRELIYRIARKNKDSEIRVAIIGYPNVGKSTLINILKGYHSVSTGSKPGLTKNIQVVRRGRLKIIDTPGIFLCDNHSMLVYTGAIRVENLDDPVYYAIILINKLKEIRKDVFYKVYGVDSDGPEELLRKIAIKRNLFLKKGEPNIEEAAKIVLRDWQVGKIIIWREPPR